MECYAPYVDAAGVHREQETASTAKWIATRSHHEDDEHLCRDGIRIARTSHRALRI